jgi:hypothetical protein
MPYAVGRTPDAVAVGDFRGDGHHDLVTANYYGDNVSVLLGNGDGTFQAPQSFDAGTQPVSVAVGDFNGDGQLDLVVANGDYYAGTVSVLLGNGDGTFQQPVSYPVGMLPRSVAVGDLRGIGQLDIVTANDVSGSISVLLGNGDGTFQKAVSYDTPPNPLSVAVGDFTGSGQLDIAVASENLSGAKGAVSVFLNNGDGTFRHGEDHAYYAAQAVAVGDFTGTGRLDLVVAYYGQGSGAVGVLLGNGDGTFQEAGSYQAGTFPQAIAVADFDQDGHNDVVVVSNDSGKSTEHDLVSVLLGNSDGTFQPQLKYFAGRNFVGVAAEDFNGDGYPDLAVVSWFHNDVRVLLNNADWHTAPSG